MAIYKSIGIQIFVNLLSILLWESFVRTRLAEINTWIAPQIENASITNIWVIIFIVSVNILVVSILIRRQKAKPAPSFPPPTHTSLPNTQLSQADKDRIRASEIDRLTSLIKEIQDKIAIKQAKGEYFSMLPEIEDGIPELLEKKTKYLSELEKLK